MTATAASSSGSRFVNRAPSSHAAAVIASCPSPYPRSLVLVLGGQGHVSCMLEGSGLQAMDSLMHGHAASHHKRTVRPPGRTAYRYGWTREIHTAIA